MTSYWRRIRLTAGSHPPASRANRAPSLGCGRRRRTAVSMHPEPPPSRSTVLGSRRTPEATITRSQRRNRARLLPTSWRSTAASKSAFRSPGASRLFSTRRPCAFSPRLKPRKRGSSSCGRWPSARATSSAAGRAVRLWRKEELHRPVGNAHVPTAPKPPESPQAIRGWQPGWQFPEAAGSCNHECWSAGCASPR